MTVRPMTEEDIPAVASTEEETFSPPWSEFTCRETLENRRYISLVLTGPEEQFAGYLFGEVILDEAELDRISVKETLRGRGLGQKLLAEFLRRAEEAGVTRFFLEVRESNTPARALYERSGFVQIGRRKNYYESPAEDALILERTAGGG